MPRMSNQKAKPLYIARMLLEHTSEIEGYDNRIQKSATASISYVYHQTIENFQKKLLTFGLLICYTTRRREQFL